MNDAASMIAAFAGHQWKQALRAPFWHRGLALKIVIGLVTAFLLLNLAALGLVADLVLTNVFPDDSPVAKFNSFLLYFFGIDLVMRFFLQKLPVLSIQHYLHLPIRKTGIVHFLLAKSALTSFNLVPLLLFVPHALKQVWTEWSPAAALVWLAFALATALANGYVAAYLKRQLGANGFVVLGAAALVIIVGLLDYYEALHLSRLSETIFGYPLESPLSLCAPVALLWLVYRLNYRLLFDHTYADEAGARRVATSIGRVDTWAARFGPVGALLSLELKLIWRNKRPKTITFMSLFFLLYGLMFYGRFDGFGTVAFLMGIGIFVTGSFMINYGQFLINWESSYFDLLMSANIRLRDYLLAKYAMLVGGSLIAALLTIPYAFFGATILAVNAAAFLFNVGVNSILLLYLATFGRRRMIITASSLMNWEGTGATQFLLILPVVILPALICWGVEWAGGQYAGIAAVALMGAAGLLLSKTWLRLVEARLAEQKYTIAEALRKK